MIKYTFGPWEIDGEEIGVNINVNGERFFKSIATIDPFPGLYQTTDALKEGECNACLIVSAPEMLEVIMDAFFGEVSASEDVRYKWQKIIEKATGNKIEQILEENKGKIKWAKKSL
ncbi:MAG: hypothetical protein PVI88_00015 [Nitrosopumilaceae archaeon]|jgi:hypothetical protein